MWFENTTVGEITFVEHAIDIVGTSPQSTPGIESDTLDVVAKALAASGENPPNGVNGFNMDFVDLDRDGRLDIVTNEFFQHLVWLGQPLLPDEPWQLHPIGTFAPDQLVGLVAAGHR